MLTMSQQQAQLCVELKQAMEHTTNTSLFAQQALALASAANSYYTIVQATKQLVN